MSDPSEYGLSTDLLPSSQTPATPERTITFPSVPNPLESKYGLASGLIAATPETTQDSRTFLDQHIQNSPDPAGEQAKIDAAQEVSKILGLPPGYTYENLGIVSQQMYGKELPAPNILERIRNTVKAGTVNHDISKLWAQAAIGFDSPELRAQIEEKKKDLPPPETQIRGFMNPVVQGLVALGYELPKTAVTGLASKEDTAARKAASVVASMLGASPAFIAFVQGGRVVGELESQAIGAKFGADIEAGMDPTVARVDAGVTGIITGALNTIQFGVAATAAQRFGTTVLMKNALSGAAVKIGLAATEQEAIAFGMMLADKMVHEGAVEASNAWTGTALPHKAFTDMLAEAGIESIPQAIIGTVIAGAGIGGETYRMGKELRARVQAEAEKVVTEARPLPEGMGAMSTGASPELTPEQRRVYAERRIVDAQAKVAEITDRLKTATPGERPILEADLADHQKVVATPVEELAKQIAQRPEDVTVGDALRAGEPQAEVTPQFVEGSAVLVERLQTAIPTKDLKGESGYVYHASNLDRAEEIASGGLVTHKPWEFTDQGAWPDGAVEKRSYWSKDAGMVWQFVPEEGQGIILRTKEVPEFKRESTGDIYTKKNVSADSIEILGKDGKWHPITELDPKLAAKTTGGGKPPNETTMSRIDRETQSTGEQTYADRRLVAVNDQIRTLKGKIEGMKADAGEQVNQYIRNIKAVDPATLRDPYRANVQAIKDVFSEVRHTKKTLDRLTEIQKSLETNPNAEFSREDLARLADLGKKPLRDLSIDELKTIHDAVVMYAKLSREEHQIKVGAVREEASKAVNDSLTEMPSAEMIQQRVVTSHPAIGEAVGDAKQWVKERLGVDILNFDLLAELAGPTVHKVVFKQVHEGHQQAMAYEQARVEDFARNTSVINEKYADTSSWLNERTVVGEAVLPNGKTVPLELSRAERLALYMHAKNPQNAAHLTEGGFGFKWRKTNRNEVYKVTPETLAKVVREVRASPEDMAYVQASDAMLKRTGQDLGSKFYDLNDVHLELGADYYRIETMPIARGKDVETEMQFGLAQADWARIGLFKGMTKRRVDSKIPLYLNPITYDLNRSLEHAAAYIGLEEPLRNASRLMYYNRDGVNFRNEMSAKLGDRGWKDLEKGLKDIAGMRDTYGVLEDAAMKLRNNIAVATLGINVPAMLRQTLGVMNYTAYVKPRYIMEGMVDCIMHPVKIDKTHRLHSPEYVERAKKGYSRETADVLKAGGYGSAFGDTKQIRSRLMAGMQYFDRFAVKRGMQGAVGQVLAEFREGVLSPEVVKAIGTEIPSDPMERMRRAYQFADYATERSQNMSIPEFQSTITRGGAGEKLLTLFASESSAAMNMRRRAYFDAKKTGSAKAWTRVASVFFVTVVANSLGSMMINRARSRALGRQVDPILKDSAYNIIGQAVSGLPVVRDLANPILRRAMLGKNSQSTSILPLQRIVDTTIGTFNSMVDAANARNASKRNRALLKTADQAAETVGLSAGIPYVPARTIVEVVVKALTK